MNLAEHTHMMPPIQTCPNLADFVSGNTRLAYVKASLRCGRAPLPASCGPAHEPLASLQKQERAWSNLDISFVPTHRVCADESMSTHRVSWNNSVVSQRYLYTLFDVESGGMAVARSDDRDIRGTSPSQEASKWRDEDRRIFCR